MLSKLHRTAPRVNPTLCVHNLFPSATACDTSHPAAQQLDGADPASQEFAFGAILALAGRAAHLEAVRPHNTRGLNHQRRSNVAQVRRPRRKLVWLSSCSE